MIQSQLKIFPTIHGTISHFPFFLVWFRTYSVFRSCKLIPTMVVASIVHRKVFSSMEYICAICVCLGLVLFAAADWNLTPSFHPIGLAFVSLSVCADAVLPNAQERLFRLGSSRLEVTCKFWDGKNMSFQLSVHDSFGPHLQCLVTSLFQYFHFTSHDDNNTTVG
jgi:hypothetical protein